MLKARHSAIKFFGLGSPTAAPLLYSYLKEHPEISLPATDPAFFSDVNRYAEGLAWYESQWPPAKEGVVQGELAYDYLRYAPAAGLIARTYPTAKVLAVIENPLLSVKVEYIEARRAGEGTARGSLADFLAKNPEVLQRACYGRQLVPYFSYYATTDLLVLTASEVRDDPLRAIATVFNHLGVDPKFVPLALRHLVVEEEDDEKKKPGLIKRTYRFLKRQIANLYGVLRRLIKPPVVPVETAAVTALALRIEPALEAKLKQYFAPDVERLENLLRRSLKSDWGFDIEVK